MKLKQILGIRPLDTGLVEACRCARVQLNQKYRKQVESAQLASSSCTSLFRRMLVAMAFLLTAAFFPGTVRASGCDVDAQYQIYPSHIFVEGQCPNHEAATQACHEFAVSHGYREDYCLNATYEPLVSAGWLWDPPYTVTFLGAFYYYEGGHANPLKNAGSTCDACFGDPVNAATGNKFETNTLYTGSGSFPLSLQLTYNSNMEYGYGPSIFGRKRSHTYSARVFTIKTGDVSYAYVTRSDGRALRYVLSGSTWVGDTENANVLTAQTSGSTIVGWQLQSEDRTTEEFDATGILQNIKNQDGLVQHLTYIDDNLTSVTDAQGRVLTFHYDSYGHVSEVVLPDGNSIALTYAGETFLGQLQYQKRGQVEMAPVSAGVRAHIHDG